MRHDVVVAVVLQPPAAIILLVKTKMFLPDRASTRSVRRHLRRIEMDKMFDKE
jgi:hypothetical protein